MRKSSLTKRMLAMLLSVVMIVGLLPTVVFAESNGWQEIGTKTFYKLEEGTITNGTYLIVAPNASYAAYMSSNTALGRQSVTITNNIIETPLNSNLANYGLWTITVGANSTVKNIGRNRYIALSANTSPLSFTTAASNVQVEGSGNQAYIRSTSASANNRGYLRYSTNTFNGVRSTSTQYLRLFKQTTETTYAKMSGETSYEWRTADHMTDAEIKNYIKAQIAVVTNTAESDTGAQTTSDYTLTGTVNPAVGGDYTYTVAYQGVTLGTINVTITDRTATGIALNANSGWVKLRANADALVNGVSMTVTYDNGEEETLPVRLSYLSGASISTAEAGVYENLTVSYEGMTVGGFTLEVTAGDDYPAYPNEGSVKITKSANTRDNVYQNTGVARVDLTAVGVPMHKPLDVVVVIDTSSSMGRYANTTDHKNSGTAWNDTSTTKPSAFRSVYSRDYAESNPNQVRFIDELAYQVEDMLYALAQPYEDGTPADVDLAMVQFNATRNTTEMRTMIDYTNDHLTNSSAVWEKGNHNGVVLGDVRNVTNSTSTHPTANDFLDINDIVNPNYRFADGKNAIEQLYDLGAYGGTNYDTALEMAYELVSQKQAANAANGEDRETIVIFMTDGVPYQYNFFTSQNNDTKWTDWLMGTYASAAAVPAPTAAHKYFYNGPGNPHRVAQAIKGDPEQLYTVVSHNQSDSVGGNAYMKEVPGLGATVYSVAFAMAYYKDPVTGTILNSDEPAATEECIDHILTNIASGDDYVLYAQNGDELGTALENIRVNALQAATEAVFEDTISDQFTLQCANTLTRASDGEVIALHTDNPADNGMTIKVGYYDCYTRGEVDGITVTQAMVGQRKSDTPTNLETITFSPDGTTATSNLLGSSNIISTNGAGEKVLEGRYVTYNFAEKKFHWNIGTLTEREVVLSFYEYLEGAMDGTAPVGSSPTNEGDAVLTYTNYLGHDCHKEVPTPYLPWKNGVVNYGFYLVDDQGNPIVNEETGLTGGYARKVEVIDKTFYSILGLNGSGDAISVSALDAVPEGYEIYDPSAAYSIYVNSDGTGHWEITKGDGLAATTYVEDYAGTTPFTNVQDSDNVTGTKDYAATTVWFAIKRNTSAVPDVIVIDYGIPVKANLLANDLVLNTLGTLTGIKNNVEGESLLGRRVNRISGFTANALNKDYGTFAIEDNMVKYTPNGMKMPKEEVIDYEVRYTGSESGMSGYYYSTFTVIPAAIIYYEDDFVTFTDDNGEASALAPYTDDSHGVWGTAGQRVSANQAEDRPGQVFSSKIDANNVYGYDQAYANCSTYSLGSAVKVQVQAGAESWPTASFEFAGTGFDLISTTDNTAGVVTVKVYDANNAVEKSIAVNNYYSAADDLYQIPVIKIEDLNYGVHKVVIQPTYASMFNFTKEDENDSDYTFTLDAIRVYDPAGVNNTGREGSSNVVLKAYQDDGEAWPVYRNFREIIKEAAAADPLKGNKIVYIDTLGKKLSDYENFFTPEGEFNPEGTESMCTTSVEDFLRIGPNNEVYIKPGVTLALNLQLPSDISRVELAAKSIVAGQNAKLNFNVQYGGVPVAQAISTATDRYYDLTGAFDMSKAGQAVNVTISNTGDADSILSLTNLKLTRTTAHNANDTIAFVSAPTQLTRSFAFTMAKALFLSMAPAEPEEEPYVNPFEDVAADAYYYDAVKWAVENGITNGYESGIFAPDNTVTRAQIVSMLWRAAGCPAASAPATFKDVKADQYYAEAVAWAVENGITNGVNKNKFAPNDICTRGQIVTFLWRYMGKPMAEKPAAFTDVPAGEYYSDAVAWLVEAGISTGKTESTFAPNDNCTRAQAVTFIMRAVVK